MGEGRAEWHGDAVKHSCGLALLGAKAWSMHATARVGEEIKIPPVCSAVCWVLSGVYVRCVCVCVCVCACVRACVRACACVREC